MRKRSIVRYFAMFIRYKIVTLVKRRIPFKDITVQEAKEKYDIGELVILDIRIKESFDNGHIEGSIHLEATNVTKNLASLPRDKIIAVMCWGGGLSKSVTNMLVRKGFINARNLKGGLTRWALDIDNELLDHIW